jgi:hypothetical protein
MWLHRQGFDSCATQPASTADSYLHHSKALAGWDLRRLGLSGAMITNLRSPADILSSPAWPGSRPIQLKSVLLMLSTFPHVHAHGPWCISAPVPFAYVMVTVGPTESFVFPAFVLLSREQACHNVAFAAVDRSRHRCGNRRRDQTVRRSLANRSLFVAGVDQWRTAPKVRVAPSPIIVDTRRSSRWAKCPLSSPR